MNFGNSWACPEPWCLACVQNENDPYKRHDKFVEMFKRLPDQNEDVQIMTFSSLFQTLGRSAQMCKYFLSCGIVSACCRLLEKATVNNWKYFCKGQRAFLPYYAVHILGSLAIHSDDGSL
jgi:hypothetical protein